MACPSPVINLTQEQSDLLETITRSREVPHSLVLRADIIRQAGQGLTNKAIGLNLGLCEETVSLWRRRWRDGVAGLEKFAGKPKELRIAVGKLLADKARPGSPGKFTAEQVCQFIALACETPPAHLSHWTLADLVRESIERGIVEDLSTSSAGRFLKSGRT